MGIHAHANTAGINFLGHCERVHTVSYMRGRQQELAETGGAGPDDHCAGPALKVVAAHDSVAIFCATMLTFQKLSRSLRALV